MDVQSQTEVNNLSSIRMEFHAWIKQRLLKCWPDSINAAAHMEQRSIVRGRRLGAQSKRSFAWLAFDICTNRVCLFCCVVRDWQESQVIRKWKEARAKTLYTFLGSVCSSVLTSAYTLEHMRRLCLFHAFFKGIRAWPQQGQLALSGPICTLPFRILECLLWREKHSGSCTAKHAHGGTSVTSSRYNHHHFLFIGALLESRCYRGGGYAL